MVLFWCLQEKSEDHVLGGSTTVMRDFFQASDLTCWEPDAAFETHFNAF